jgi:hypothetical protein
MIDITKLQAGIFAGLSRLGPPLDKQFAISSFSLPAQATNTLTFFIATPDTSGAVLSNMRVQLTGCSSQLSNYWYPINGGALTILDQNTAGTGTAGWVYTFSVQPASGGRNLKLRLLNNTVGATLTFPNATLYTHTNFYTYPW